MWSPIRIIGFCLLCSLFIQTASALPTFRSEQGLISGFAFDEVIEYRGIPFAEPPLGKLRFEAPRRGHSWNGTWIADHWRSACPQPGRFGQTDESLNEDCLYLNVAFTRSTQQKRPVLIWFYGGAYVGGSANLYRLDWLAKHTNAIIVAGNYRVGALGFLNHPQLDPKISSSLGLLDQKLLIEWVHRNIAQVGGDPNNITIAGESAGAISVCLHLASPLNSVHTFQKAIIQSGACLAPLPRQSELNVYGLELAERVHCKPYDLKCLKMVPIVELLAAQTAILDENSHAFIPAIGSAFLPDDPRDRFKHGQFVRVPILNGGNQDEMTLYVGYQVALGEHITDESLVSNLSIPYGPHAQDLLIEYGDDNEFRALSAPQKLGRLETDFVPPGVLSQCLMLSSALTLSQFVPIYEYEFTERNGPTQIAPEPFKLGAVHAAELPYLFAHISHNHRLDGPDLSESSSRLSMTMLKLWGAFIQTGTPQIAEAPRWLPFQSRRFVYELNTERLGEINAWQRHHCDFWNHLFPEAF